MKYNSITIQVVANGYSVSARTEQTASSAIQGFTFIQSSNNLIPANFVFNTASALADWIEANVEQPDPK